MRLLVLAALLLSSDYTAVRPTIESNEVAATVRLVSDDGSCSGVVLSPHSILTAAHCYSVTPMQVYDFQDNELCVGVSVKADTGTDLMLLRTGCELPVSASIGTVEPYMGSKVQVTGHPLGVEFPVLTEGFLTTVTQKHSIAHNKQVLSAPIIGGNSGGPVWLDGKVVGIVSCGSEEYHHISFIVRQRTIQEFLNGQQL